MEDGCCGCCGYDFDWEGCTERCRSMGPVWAGALFGAGVWCILDVVCITTKYSDPMPFYAYVPGLVAALAALLLNVTSRERLASLEGEGEDCWARVWLLFCYLMSIGAAVGAVVVLFSDVGHPLGAYAGATGVMSTGLILGGGLLMWVVRSTDGE
ncbi:unnamed protein product [Ostreobium quekettii]|uniref:Uncharacterized protein n=1 Tax=Ostreobium quekettii TaxID=121088 RepID=A0A8S1JH77_9CHLO|nr:unnamed protein product [Ostreobium quekettii]|eukprot:evm.model.scf_1727.2 EVM.evm.TU.scf_1727.2   scf_1727:5285-5749(-)